MEKMAITADVIPLSQCETEVVSKIGKSSSNKRKKNDDQDGLRGSLAMISPEVQENTADNSIVVVVPLSQEERPQTKKRKPPKKRVKKK